MDYIRNKEPVCARECVKNLHSRETWLKEAKVVRVSKKAKRTIKNEKMYGNFKMSIIVSPLRLVKSRS